MSTPRRHHLLPQFYLSSFATRRRQVRVVPRPSSQNPIAPYTTSIRNAMVERDYYTYTDAKGDEHLGIEEAYAMIESAAAKCLRILLQDGLTLSPDERSLWAVFMSAQVTRGRQFRAMFEQFAEQVAKAGIATAAANAPDEYWQRINEHAVAAGGEPLPPVTPEMRERLIEGSGFKIRPSKQETIAMSFAAFEELASIFTMMTWKLVRFERSSLFTSDHPVLYWREPDSMPPFMGIGPATASEVRIALSPSACLILVHPFEVIDADDAEHQGDDEIVKYLNRDVLRWPASRQWLLSPDVRVHPLPATLRAWDGEWRRPWTKTGRYR